MSIYEYDEERHIRQTREEGVEDGVNKVAINLIKASFLTDAQIEEVTGLSQSQLDTLRKNENTQ